MISPRQAAVKLFSRLQRGLTSDVDEADKHVVLDHVLLSAAHHQMVAAIVILESDFRIGPWRSGASASACSIPRPKAPPSTMTSISACIRREFGWLVPLFQSWTERYFVAAGGHEDGESTVLPAAGRRERRVFDETVLHVDDDQRGRAGVHVEASHAPSLGSQKAAVTQWLTGDAYAIAALLTRQPQ